SFASFVLFYPGRLFMVMAGLVPAPSPHPEEAQSAVSKDEARAFPRDPSRLTRFARSHLRVRNCVSQPSSSPHPRFFTRPGILPLQTPLRFKEARGPERRLAHGPSVVASLRGRRALRRSSSTISRHGPRFS